jgi:hypothetical protein
MNICLAPKSIALIPQSPNLFPIPPKLDHLALLWVKLEPHDLHPLAKSRLPENIDKHAKDIEHSNRFLNPQYLPNATVHLLIEFNLNAFLIAQQEGSPECGQTDSIVKKRRVDGCCIRTISTSSSSCAPLLSENKPLESNDLKSFKDAIDCQLIFEFFFFFRKSVCDVSPSKGQKISFLLSKPLIRAPQRTVLKSEYSK